MSVDEHRQVSNETHVTQSVNSGRYDPGPMVESGEPNAELATVQAQRNDLMPEEFPDGPYGAATQPDHLGKSGHWRPGQASISPYWDENPVFSDRKRPRREPPHDAPSGSIEGQN